MSDFLSWYLQKAIPDFLSRRLQDLAAIWRYLNITGLARTIFAPYRRLTVEKEAPQYGVSGLFDKIVFNTISRLVGAWVRLFLIIVGLFGLFFYLPLIILYSLVFVAIPIFSLPKFLGEKAHTIDEIDLASRESLIKKITVAFIFKHLCDFFDDDFKTLFENLPADGQLKIAAGEKVSAAVISLVQNWQDLKSYLEKQAVTTNQFQMLVSTVQSYHDFEPKRPLIPIGQNLAFGYTRTLEKFARVIYGQNLFLTETEKAVTTLIEKVLVRPQNNNVILSGEPGVGRHATIENLATAIANSHLPALSTKQIVYLDTIALAGTGKNLVEVKSNFQSVLVEAKGAGNVILIIDQIDKIVSSKDSRLDLSEVLTFALSHHELPIVGITTPDEFSQYIRPNTAVLKFFEKIDLEEAKPQETLQILIGRALNALAREKVKSDLSALVEIVERSNQLIVDRKQPEKAIILFDEATAQARDLGQKITIRLVDAIISQKTKTPIGVLTKSESAKLKNLEDILHKRVIGQDEAVSGIAKATRRARVEIENTQKPIGSFLFLGPTGVGKTETAKALAEAYFGDENKQSFSANKMIRLDMSEYQGNDALPRLIGDATSKSPGILASQVRDHPFGILLLDEFEKANLSVHNLFLQVLDEGFLTDSFGKKVSFDNIIIIATSNAGAEFIREQLQNQNTSEVGSDSSEVKESKTQLSRDLVNYILQKGLFFPELINRFDGVIVYHPLTEEEIAKVTTLMLKNLSAKLKETKNITLEITDELAARVAKAGYNPQFGARPIKRLIADKIEDEIAKMIIDGSIKNGDTIPAVTLLKFVS